MSIIEKRAFHYTPIKTLLFKKTYFYLFFLQLRLLLYFLCTNINVINRPTTYIKSAALPCWTHQFPEITEVKNIKQNFEFGWVQPM